MESKTSSGQILIECALMLVFIALMFWGVLDFNGHDRAGRRSKQEIIRSKQALDFREYRNGDRR